MAVYPHSYHTKNIECISTSSTYGAYYAKHKSCKIKIQLSLNKIFQWVDTCPKYLIQHLTEVVEIPSISGSLEHREDVLKMIKMTEKWFVKLGMKHECFNVGFHYFDGQKFTIPPVILGELGNDKNKYTICVYGSLDVQDPTKQKGWKTDPFTLTSQNKTLYGCGVGTCKAPLMMWFHAIQAFQENQVELPVNLRFIIESMREQSNDGLEQLLRSQKIGLLKGIDFLVVNDSHWLGKNLPCLTYGAVGYGFFSLTSEKVEGSNSDPRDDLKTIMASMVNERDTVLIKDHDSNVEHITPEEEMVYEQIQDFNVNDLKESFPDSKRSWGKVKLLTYFWRLPGKKINEIEECNCEKKGTQPKKLKQTYLYKLVPYQIPKSIEKCFHEHINKVVEANNIKNKIVNKMMDSLRPWVEDAQSAHYQAAKRATIQIYKEIPSMIRLAYGIPIILILKRVFNTNLLLLPLFNSNVNFREPNENISERAYLEGTKLHAAYMIQVSYIKRTE